MIMQPPALMEFRDDFNRADNASDIGTDWRPDFSNDKIVTNRAQIRTPASNTGRQGAWETYVSSSYNGGRLLTDNWRIEDTIAAPVGAAATDNASGIGGAMLDAGPASGMVLVYAIYLQGTVSGTGMAIYTYSASVIASPGASSGQTGQTVRGTTATNRVSAADVMWFDRRMYSATQSVFTLYQNGVSRCVWDDTGGVVPAGDRTKRRWFHISEGNFPIFQQAFYSAAHDGVRALDLKG